MESQSTDSCQCFSPDSCSYLLMVYNLGNDQCVGTSYLEPVLKWNLEVNAFKKNFNFPPMY